MSTTIKGFYRSVCLSLTIFLASCATTPPQPLPQAAMSGNLPEVKRLVEAGVDMKQHDHRYRLTALHYASRNGHTNIVEYLLSKGADPNDAEKRTRMTPLHFAAYHGHKAVIELLIEAGARTDARNARGETPWDMAKRKGHEDLAELLR